VSQKHCVSSKWIPNSKAASGMVDSLLYGSDSARTAPPVGPTNPGSGPQRDSQSYASRRPCSSISCKAWEQPALVFRAPQLQGQKRRNSSYLIAKRLSQAKSFGAAREVMNTALLFRWIAKAMWKPFGTVGRSAGPYQRKYRISQPAGAGLHRLLGMLRR